MVRNRNCFLILARGLDDGFWSSASLCLRKFQMKLRLGKAEEMRIQRAAYRALKYQLYYKGN